MSEQHRAQVLLIDDDLLIRELLELLLSRKGYEVYQAGSGEEALSMLAGQQEGRPSVVLADMQLPGIAGPALAHRLRRLLGSKTRIVAMSGNQLTESELQGFDGFAKKPFDEGTLDTLFQASVPLSEVRDGNSPAVSPLDATVYDRLASSMSQEQLTQLYQLCIDDSRRRIGVMWRAAGDNDLDACRKEAHAIKGSCGMVGATEIALLGEFIESHGLTANLEDCLDELMLACRRFENQLRARGLGIQQGDRLNARRAEV